MPTNIEKFVTAVIDNMKHNGATEVRLYVHLGHVVLEGMDASGASVRKHSLHRTRNRGDGSVARQERARRAAEMYIHWVKLIAKKRGLKC